MPVELSDVSFEDEPEAGPLRSGYKFPKPRKSIDVEEVTFDDDAAARMTRNHLERQRRGEGELARAVTSRMTHNASAGLSDEAAGVPGGILGAIRATGQRMRSGEPIDPNAQFDEFGNQIGGTTSMAAAGGYTEARDADRAEQASLADRNKLATALVDVGSAVAPGATARLAVQGFGDSEATTAVGLGKDAAVGLGAAAAAELGGRVAAKLAGKIGGAFAKKAAPEAERAVDGSAKAAGKAGKEAKAPMTPELLESVRAEQAIQEGVTVNGRPLGQVPNQPQKLGQLPVGPAGRMTVNGAPLGQVPAKAGAAPLPPPAAPVGVPSPAPKPAPGPGIGTNLRDLAAASLADYAVAKAAKELDLPYGGPLITAVVAAKKASAKASAGGAVTDLVTKAHEAGLDVAAAKRLAELLPQAAGALFLDRFLTRSSK